MQEQLDCEENIVIVDSKGQEIHDSPGTQGRHYSLHHDFRQVNK